MLLMEEYDHKPYFLPLDSKSGTLWGPLENPPDAFLALKKRTSGHPVSNHEIGNVCHVNKTLSLAKSMAQYALDPVQTLPFRAIQKSRFSHKCYITVLYPFQGSAGFREDSSRFSKKPIQAPIYYTYMYIFTVCVCSC